MTSNGKRRLMAGLAVAGGIVLATLAARTLWTTEVSVSEVRIGKAVDAVPGVVRVSAGHASNLRSRAEGRIVEAGVEAGDRVSGGNLLFRLDPGEIELEMERVRLEYETEQALEEVGVLARYELEEARAELESMRERYREGGLSRRELDAGERRVARLVDEIELEEIRHRRRIALLENELRRLERKLEELEVRAPMDGSIVEVYARTGDVVSPGASLARMMSSEQVVEASISEEHFAGIETGLSATVRLLIYGNRLFPASVSRVLPAADPDTRRHTVHLDVEMDDARLVPGITGETSIIRDERDDALLVPRRALMGERVFAVRNGRAELREVETGFTSLTWVEVLDGLEAGERVVVENLDRLRAGDRVRIGNP